jgi:RNA polymerase sigma-70 factor (ECF subfamily)
MWKRRKRPDLYLAGPPGPAADPLSEVARRASDGHREAVHELLVAIGPSLLKVARQILGPAHPELHDVAQEAAFGMLRALSRFRGECTVRHFACRVAVLAAMNVRRRDVSQRSKVKHLWDEQHDAAGTASPEQLLLDRRAAGAVRELLGQLPLAQAEVLGLHYVVGLTAQEIAAVTQAPVETVRSRLRLGRQALKERVLEDRELRDVMGVSDGQPR